VVGRSSDAQECSGCHLAPAAGAADASLTAHATHASAEGVADAIGCGDCHPVPATLDAAGHMDGTVDVVFSQKAGGAGARWDGSRQSCAVYCHGGATPIWTKVDGSYAACGSCHGTPPGGAHPQTETQSDACAACHSATVRADGTIDLAGGKHVNGIVDRAGGAGAACGSCHGIPPTTNGHATSTACGSCHDGYTADGVNAALHQNGTKDVTAQVCGSCHAVPPGTGKHAKHVGERISCGGCHAGASTSAGGPGHMSGAVDVSAPGWNAATRSCANSCHGDKRW
jgi:predicted CxxxxCH...CXXCH cytochrome family protein